MTKILIIEDDDKIQQFLLSSIRELDPNGWTSENPRKSTR